MRAHHYRFALRLLSLFGLIAFVSACGPVGSDNPSSQSSPPINSPGGNPSTGGGIGALYKPVPLPWEGVKKNGVLWSAFTYQIIGNAAAEFLLPGADDIQDFCPNYRALSNPERANFWGYLIAMVAKYESAFNPTSRYLESTMGIDPITRLPVYSEGLLQLSYQDIQAYSFCQFDWSADKILSPTDPKKSILDPLKNLECGIKILASQIHRTKHIALTTGVYWSTLKLNGRYSKLPEIEAATNAIPFCAAN